MKRLLTLLCAGAALGLPVASHALADGASLDRALENLESIQQRMEHQMSGVAGVMQLAQATLAAVEASESAEPPEPPEPPEAPEPPEVPPFADFAVDIANDALGSIFGSSGRAASQPVIVAANGIAPAKMAELQEDLSVMGRILNKAVERSAGQDKRDRAMGIVISSMPGGRRPQSIYLEGYGALFLLNVGFPLVAPPAKPPVEPANKTDNTVWEETKRELYGPREPARVWEFESGNRQAAEYRPERVAALKRELSDALKNAANLRHVRSEDNICLVVTGASNTPAAPKAKRGSEASARSGAGVGSAQAGREGVSRDGGKRETTLVLLARKSEVESFAKGKLSPEEFLQQLGAQEY